MDSGLINAIGKHDQLMISQEVDWIECLPLLSCCEKRNVYNIFTMDDKLETKINQIAQIIEQKGESKNNSENLRGLLCLFCFKWGREYTTDFRVQDYTVSQAQRQFKCGGSPFNCLQFIDLCQQSLSVYKYQNLIGTITWPYSCFFNYPGRGCLSCLELDVKSHNGDLLYKITAPCLQPGFLCWQFGCIPACSKRIYQILDHNNTQVGTIQNVYNGIIQEVFTRADQFIVKFPNDADLDRKLLLLQATVFIDYLQYAA